MRSLQIGRLGAVVVAVGALALLGGSPVSWAAVRADEEKSAMKPDVAELVKQSTDVYKKMKSYRHTANGTTASRALKARRMRM